MSGYHIERSADRPIIFFTTYEDFTVGEHWASLQAELNALLDDSGSPTYIVNDIKDFHLSVGDIIHAANDATRSKRGLLKHPNLAEWLLVTTSSVIELAVKGMHTDMFGNQPVMVIPTMEEAMAYIDSKS